MSVTAWLESWECQMLIWLRATMISILRSGAYPWSWNSILSDLGHLSRWCEPWFAPLAVHQAHLSGHPSKENNIKEAGSYDYGQSAGSSWLASGAWLSLWYFSWYSDAFLVKYLIISRSRKKWDEMVFVGTDFVVPTASHNWVGL